MKRKEEQAHERSDSRAIFETILLLLDRIPRDLAEWLLGCRWLLPQSSLHFLCMFLFFSSFAQEEQTERPVGTTWRASDGGRSPLVSGGRLEGALITRRWLPMTLIAAQLRGLPIAAAATASPDPLNTWCAWVSWIPCTHETAENGRKRTLVRSFVRSVAGAILWPPFFPSKPARPPPPFYPVKKKENMNGVPQNFNMSNVNATKPHRNVMGMFGIRTFFFLSSFKKKCRWWSKTSP